MRGMKQWVYYGILFYGFILLILIQIKMDGSTFINDDKVDWERVYKVVTENKLPLLSEEEEKKIIEETERILREEKSIYSAIEYISVRVSEKSRNLYVIYGNPRIKEELVKLFKMRVQCEVKEFLEWYNPTTIKERWGKEMQLSEEQIQKVLDREKGEIESAKRLLETLKLRDGDLCPECYLFDKKEKEILTPPQGMEKEYEPEGYYEILSAFCSIVLSTFSDNIYDYLWTLFDFKMDLPETLTSFVIAKLYPEQFLNDVETVYDCGEKHGSRFYREKGGSITYRLFFNTFDAMIRYNIDFVTKNKKKIKEIISKHYQDIQHIDYFEKILGFYEKIGEKEDIEFIKELGEKIDYTYQVREVTEKEKVSAKEKEKVLNQVKQFKDRVNALVEKLSRQ